ncbi:hypothetical protein LSH36_20g15001 [Paralvinella palmiformis]|uniref:Uncharacterized protein n=1 Tax=Paralvinella palmiformis TaxID=53620 RepID=A0AAD9KBJ1_9ANNE|nr:hypothetical protein LSH36_20g15001 [Paralvinella palmiformis]
MVALSTRMKERWLRHPTPCTCKFRATHICSERGGKAGFLLHGVVPLTCLVGEERASAALQKGSKLQTTDLRVSFSPSLVEECISIKVWRCSPQQPDDK